MCTSDIIIDNTKEGNNESFQKIRLIGKGNLGEVYLVKSLIEKEEYALKELIVNNPNSEEIEKEAKNLKNLDHPNITNYKSIFISNSHNELLNIITEYADNGDFSKEIFKYKKKNKTFEENQLLDWIIQNSLALSYIHSKKIIHGDIKPSNIFLTKNNSIKLGDFGIFKKIFNLDYNNLYIAPEIIEKKEYSYEIDIWSLGVVFCHLMALEFPFEGKNKEEIYENILKGNKNQKIVNKDNKYNEKILKNYSEEFLNLIDEMMSLDPLQRPMAEEILRKDIIKKRMNDYLEENNFDEKNNNEVCASISKNLENFEKKRRRKFKESIIVDNEKNEKNIEENLNLSQEKEGKKNNDSIIFDQSKK